MSLGKKLSLRDKIFRQLSNIPKDNTDKVTSKPVCSNPQKLDSNCIVKAHDSDTDSEGSLDDHLVNLEDIDLDSQFFSQDYTVSTQEPLSALIKAEEKNNNDSTIDLCNAEENQVVYEKLKQLANYEQIRNETRALLLGKDARTKATTAEPTNGTKCFTDQIVLIEDDSEEEWVQIDNCSDQKPTDSVEVLINQQSQKNGKHLDVDAQLKRLLQTERREKRLLLHKIHLLCLLGHGFYLNKLVNEMVLNQGEKILEMLQHAAEDILDHIDLNSLEQICTVYRNSTKLQPATGILNESMGIKNKAITSKEFNVLLFAAVLRFFSIEARLVLSLNVLPKSFPLDKSKSHTKNDRNVKYSKKPTEHLSNDSERYPDVPLTTAEILKRKPEMVHFSQIPQMDGSDDFIEEKRPRLSEVAEPKPKLWKLKRCNNPLIMKSTFNSTRSKTTRGTKSPYFTPVEKKTTTNRRVSPVSKNPVPDNPFSIWVEVMLPVEKRWHPVDIMSENANSLEHIVNTLPQPPAYIFGWNYDGTLQDVTPRYWWLNEMGARKLRVSDKWLQPLLYHFGRKRKELRYLLDAREFRQLRYRAPIPEKLPEFKNHPSYCLKRDLLKFQAIYPVDAPPLEFFRGEPIYARECVHTLHSREVWLRHAKVIRLHEKPYKIVMSKLKREKTDLELYGFWQTEEYIPPEPQNGRVPRNAYGNIEIFKDCMLPKGTVHLKQNNISRICRRLNVDYATAVVGFGIHAGGNHPVFEGIVICKEFEERVLHEYERDKLDQEQRQLQQREKIIYANWRKLIKGMLIRSRLKQKYNFDGL